jgi:hypothetical protein
MIQPEKIWPEIYPAGAESKAKLDLPPEAASQPLERQAPRYYYFESF